MSDIVWRLRARQTAIRLEAAEEIEFLRAKLATQLSDWHDAEVDRLRSALKRLVNDSMYKDHPEASQMAIDALGGVDWMYRN